MRPTSLAFAFLSLLATTGRADVTLRQSFNLTSTVIPQQAWDAMKQFVTFPMEMTTRVKGDHAYATFGSTVSLVDLTKNQLTLLDTKNRKFAIVPMDQYVTRLRDAQKTPEMPPEVAQMFAAMKLDVKTRATGRTETIRGIPTDENETTLTLEMPMPGQATTMQMVLTLQTWSPKPDEIQKSPALREIFAYQQQSKSAMDPSAFLKQMFANMPGLGDKLSGPIEQLTKNTGMLLKMRGQLSVPAMAAALPPGTPSGPALELTMDVLDLSSDSVPEALLRVPEGYEAAPLEDLMKGFGLAMPPPPQVKQ